MIMQGLLVRPKQDAEARTLRTLPQRYIGFGEKRQEEHTNDEQNHTPFGLK